MAYRGRWLRFKKGTRGDEIPDELAEVFKLAPENPLGYAAAASGYILLGKEDSAAAMIKEYRESAEYPGWAPVLAADLGAATGDTTSEETARLLKEIALAFPNSPAADLYLGKVLYPAPGKIASDTTARLILEARTAADPAGYYQLALYELNAIGDTAAAAKAAKTYIEAADTGGVDPIRNPGFRLANMHRVVALERMKAGEFAEALEHISRALKLNDESGQERFFAVLAAEMAFSADERDKAEDFIMTALSRGSVLEVRELLREHNPENADSLLEALFELSASRSRSAPEIPITAPSGIFVPRDNSAACIFFWSPDSRPCMENLPSIRKLAEKYKRTGIRFLAVTERSRLALQKNPVKLGHWETCPGGRNIMEEFGVEHVPQFFLLDGGGRIRYHQVGAPLDTEQVSVIIDLMMGNYPSS